MCESTSVEFLGYFLTFWLPGFTSNTAPARIKGMNSGKLSPNKLSIWDKDMFLHFWKRKSSIQPPPQQGRQIKIQLRLPGPLAPLLQLPRAGRSSFASSFPFLLSKEDKLYQNIDTKLSNWIIQLQPQIVELLPEWTFSSSNFLLLYIYRVYQNHKGDQFLHKLKLSKLHKTQSCDLTG